MEQEFELIAKTFMGLEPVLAEELTQLGANNVQIEPTVSEVSSLPIQVTEVSLVFLLTSSSLRPSEAQ